MWMQPTVAAIVLALVILARRRLPVSAVLGLWLVSPMIAWWLSRRIPTREAELSEGQIAFLRKLARRTWAYFETFVTADENWLPPDNFQEHPATRIASRTSPTNIGVALLANLCANDFGYCSAAQLLQRTEKTLATVGRLERHRGHFYNWYDTHSLQALPPRYVSTIDSGNFAGHLLVLRSGLLELLDTKILPPRVFDGVQDTAWVLFDAIRGFIETMEPSRSLSCKEALRKIDRLVAELRILRATSVPHSCSCSVQRIGRATLPRSVA